MKVIYLLPGLFFFLSSCDPLESTLLEGEVDAYVPVYANAQNINQITVEAAQPVEHAGKIYVYGNYLFQNDLYKGIHIIDNSNKSLPKKLAFIKIPLSTELAVKGNHLYSNNYDDIVVFDLTNITNPQLVKRLEDVFPPVQQDYPPVNNVYFECADPSKGLVVRWDLKRIKVPHCKR
ncbi:MAG TPA: hypothetical protein VM012_15620 [Flavitalea sp.]|nr:hypothetical protein [Flavitalea sp.]